MGNDGSSIEIHEKTVFGVGIVLVLAALYLVWVVIGITHLGWGYQKADLRIGIGAGAATIALATGIFVQGYLNSKRIEGEEKNRLILQESNWMPAGEFKSDGLQFEFIQNPPYNPRVMLDIGQSESGWIESNVKSSTYEYGEIVWRVGIGGDIFEDSIDFEDNDYEGKLRLQFESTTGVKYEYEYDVIYNSKADNEDKIRVKNERRRLPWRDEID
ncbi:MAG: hypothetical protein U5J98_06845 [Halobacteriales archaeon]|nr:hypothetical protein [Halobacteriales archaeon]